MKDFELLNRIEIKKDLVHWSIILLKDLPSSTIVPNAVNLLMQLSSETDDVFLTKSLTEFVIEFLLYSTDYNYDTYGNWDRERNSRSQIMYKLFENTWISNMFLEHNKSSLNMSQMSKKHFPSLSSVSGMKSNSQMNKKTIAKFNYGQANSLRNNNSQDLFKNRFITVLCRVLNHILPIALARVCQSCDNIVAFYNQNENISDEKLSSNSVNDQNFSLYTTQFLFPKLSQKSQTFEKYSSLEGKSYMH